MKSDFEQRAKKFRDERNNAWDEFLDLSAQAGYNIKNTLANRSLFMAGYESGKEARAAINRDSPEWVAVEDRLPGKQDAYLARLEIFNKDGEILGRASDVRYFIDGEWNDGVGSSPRFEQVVAYMRIPPYTKPDASDGDGGGK